MSNGNSMKICPLGNTQEMFKPQIRSYPIKNLRGNFSYSEAKSNNERGKLNTEIICTILQLHHFGVIYMREACLFKKLMNFPGSFLKRQVSLSQGHIPSYQYGILEMYREFVLRTNSHF